MRVLLLDSVHILSVADIIHTLIKHDDPLPLSTFTLPVRCARAAANSCFNLLFARNASGQRLIEYHGALIWNAIPTDVKAAHNFSAAMKHFIFSG